MDIGRNWTGWRLWAALAIAGAAITVDFVYAREWAFSGSRFWLGFGALIALLTLARGRAHVLGIQLGAQPRWAYWLKWGLVIGGIVLGFTGIVALVAWLIGHPFDVQCIFSAESQILPHGFHMCVHAPVVEELLYRAVLCAPLVPLLGTRGTILIGGAVFGALHVRYGNPAPNNLIAGFLLTWAYLRSSNLLVPVLLHALGNAFVWGVHAGFFYWQQA